MRTHSQPDVTTKLLALAGLAGPIIFTASFVMQGVVNPEYSHIADPVSALAAGPHGWVQNVTFAVFGVLVIAYAFGLDRGIRPVRLGRIGIALLVLGGVGLVLAGVFPARDAAGAFATNPRHLTAAVLSFLGTGLGLTLLGRRMASDARWRGYARFTSLAGIMIAILFLTTGPAAIPPDAPLHPWLGLLQRITLAVWFAATIVLALRLPNGGATPDSRRR